MFGVGHVVTTSIGMCDIDLRPVQLKYIFSYRLNLIFPIIVELVRKRHRHWGKLVASGFLWSFEPGFIHQNPTSKYDK